MDNLQTDLVQVNTSKTETSDRLKNKTDTRAETINQTIKPKGKNKLNKVKGKDKLFKFQSGNSTKFSVPTNRNKRQLIKV